jgi:DNA-binding CsgD family transcriptional regulator
MSLEKRKKASEADLSNHINDICKPLFHTFGLDYFSFHRIFHCGKFIYLSTLPEWIDFYYCQHLNADGLAKYCDVHKSEYLLWTEWPENDKGALEIFKDSKEIFNLDRGFTIVKPQKEYTDLFTFAVFCSNVKKVRYFSNIEIFEKFILYFLNKSIKLIDTASVRSFNSNPNKNIHLNENISSVESRNKFYEEVNVKNLCIKRKSDSKFIMLTNKETNCLVNICKGRSAKQTAKHLSLSPRTVESHINNIKLKTDYNSKNELIEQIFDCEYSRNFLLKEFNL